MRRTDVMMGDWLESPEEKTFGPVIGIDPEMIGIQVGENVDDWIYALPELFAGVPLTEEILTLNGWRDCDGYMVHKEVPGVELLRRNQGWLWCDGYGGGEYVVSNINCVHELQHVLRILGCDELADDFEIE